MTTIQGLQNIGRMALGSNQRALSVAGDNIANVNTEGFSRRRAQFASTRDGGVTVLSVERLRDQFVIRSMRDNTARLGSRSVAAGNLQLLEASLNESENSGVSRSLQDFFNALQDLAVNPAGIPERQSVLSQSNRLVATLQGVGREIARTRDQIDSQLRQELNRANEITSALASMNTRFTGLAGSGSVNSQLDARDRLIDELSSFLPVRVIEEPSGAVTILAEGGTTLVEHSQNFELVALNDPALGGFAHVGITGISGDATVIDGRLTEGSIHGLLATRDGDARRLLNNLERIGAQLIQSFNIQHRRGTDLDGGAGGDFFSGLDVTAASRFANAGGGQVTAASITDDTLLTFRDYEIRFGAAGAYEVVDAANPAPPIATGTYTSPGPEVITFDGISVTIGDGAGPPVNGDVFEVNTFRGTLDRLSLAAGMVNDPRAIAAAFSDAPGDNENALALGSLRDLSFAILDDGTFEEFYDTARARLGIAVESATNSLRDAEVARFQIEELVDRVSGVSLDEEAINLLQYQRAFQAASRLIGVADELIQTILTEL